MSTNNIKLKESPRITEVAVTDKGEISLEWIDVTEATKYAIKRADKFDGEFEVVGWSKKNNFIDKTVEKNITYWYRIFAVKVLADKNRSKKTGPVKAQVVSSIPAPESLSAVCKGNRIKLQWKKPSKINSFMVYRRNAHFSQMMPLCMVEGNSFFDGDIVQGQLYYYSVQSLDGGKHGNFSNEAYCVCLDSGKIIYSKAKFFKKVELKTRIVSGADGYIFERSEDGLNFEEIARTDSDISTAYTDTVPKAFCYYYYQVKAYKKIGDEIVVSKGSRLVKVKTK